MRAGHNQYAPVEGVLALREVLSEKIARVYGAHYDPVSEINITSGAQQALFTILLASIHKGDEVLVLEPAYDCYKPAIILAGGVYVPVALDAQFRPDFEAIRQKITPRTRLIIINSPHNPSSTVWTEQEMVQLQTLVQDHNLLVISDEVYQHIVFDQTIHQSSARYPQLKERTFIVASFGKTYHVTGWKIGYLLAPEPLMQRFRKVHQYNVFSTQTPVQHGLAHYIASHRPYESLPSFYQEKRDLFRNSLQGSGFHLLPCEGTYFQCLDYSALSDLNDVDFATWLLKSFGVAAIPISKLGDIPSDRKVLRFCFAKKRDTLESAAERLNTI